MSTFDTLRQLFPNMLRPTPAARTADELANILGVATTALPALRLGGPYFYRPFAIEKRDGRERHILAPSTALKKLQRALVRHWQTLPTHPCAFAYRPYSSHVLNAVYHSWQRLIVTVDLQDFFPSMNTRRVRGFLSSQGWTGAKRATLLRLCVFAGGLPQGAPTSPILSNLVNAPLDQTLQEFTRERGGLYSRYADDLTFSWNDDRLPPGFPQGVEDILRRFRYTVQLQKGWRITPIEERPWVTGIELRGDGRLRLPWALRWRWWKARFCGSWNGRTLAQLNGYKGYARLVKRSQLLDDRNYTLPPPYAATVSGAMLPNTVPFQQIEDDEAFDDEDKIPF